jgi:hypothetical protein
MKLCALAGAAFFTYDLPYALQFLSHLLIGGDDVIECVCDFSG